MIFIEEKRTNVYNFKILRVICYIHSSKLFLKNIIINLNTISTIYSLFVLNSHKRLKLY